MPARFRNLPIRTRVAWTILSLSSAALVAMALGVYLAFESSLRSNFDDTLRTRAASNLTLVDESSGSVALRLSLDPGNERAEGESLIRLYGPGGELRVDGAPAAGASSDEPILVRRVARSSAESLATVEYGGGEQFRVLASPIFHAGVLDGVLVTGLETAQVEEPLAILRVILAVAVAITSVVLAIGAFLIARRALRPVAAISASASRIANGDFRERISGIHSQDEVGELATTFNNMIDRVAETVERERRFTADAAHELRTPLAALETSIDVTLAQPRTTSEYEETLVAMRGQTVRLTALTRQLMTLSRLDNAGVGATFEELDLASLLGVLIGAFQESHPGVTWTVAGLAVPAPFRGDLHLLARLFGNVFENAVVHGSPDVHISVAIACGPGGTACVTVHDDGPGIPEAFHEFAFQRFRRGDESRGRGGSGLGLAIVESVARAHGGRARLLYGGVGTTIEVILPLASE